MPSEHVSFRVGGTLTDGEAEELAALVESRVAARGLKPGAMLAFMRLVQLEPEPRLSDVIACDEGGGAVIAELLSRTSADYVVRTMRFDALAQSRLDFRVENVAGWIEQAPNNAAHGNAGPVAPDMIRRLTYGDLQPFRIAGAPSP